MVKQELAWKTLFKAWSTTLAIYTLSGSTPILMELLLEGTISRIAFVSFIIGFWGVFSGGLIYMLKQKGQTLEESDFKSAAITSMNIQQMAAGQVLSGAESQKEIREQVKQLEKEKKYRTEVTQPPIEQIEMVSASTTESQPTVISSTYSPDPNEDPPIVEPI